MQYVIFVTNLCGGMGRPNVHRMISRCEILNNGVIIKSVNCFERRLLLFMQEQKHIFAQALQSGKFAAESNPVSLRCFFEYIQTTEILQPAEKKENSINYGSRIHEYFSRSRE